MNRDNFAKSAQTSAGMLRRKLMPVLRKHLEEKEDDDIFSGSGKLKINGYSDLPIMGQLHHRQGVATNNPIFLYMCLLTKSYLYTERNILNDYYRAIKFDIM
jgi:hypothetical protein